MNQERKIGTLLGLATTQGRIPLDQVANYATLAKTSYDALVDTLARQPVTQQPTKDSPQQGWGFGEWRKFAPKALEEMAAKAPSQYNALKDLYLTELRHRGR